MTFDFYYDDDWNQMLTVALVGEAEFSIYSVWIDLALVDESGLYRIDCYCGAVKPKYILRRLQKEVPSIGISYTKKQVMFDKETRILMKLKFGVDINVNRSISAIDTQRRNRR